MKSIFWVLLFGLLLFIDQFSKKMVLSGYRFKKGIFEITLVYNEGSAFGIKFFKNYEYLIVNTFILIIFSMFIFYKVSKIGDFSLKSYYLFSFVFIVAGGVGNLVDRIFYGKVVDFISIYTFPVFNIADVFITVGILILSFLILSEHKKQNL